MKVTKQQLADTEGVIDLWWVGIDPIETMSDFKTSYNLDEVMSGASILGHYTKETIELLTLWRGYIDSSLEESVQPSVEDFVLATYTINKESRR